VSLSPVPVAPCLPRAVTGEAAGEATGGIERSVSHEAIDPLAMVQLSFEPIVNTDAESISELFNVIYNTIQSKYNEFHHRGVLGQTALSWLTEAVGEAMDSASCEVNALTSECLEKKKRKLLARTSVLSSRKTEMSSPDLLSESQENSAGEVGNLTSSKSMFSFRDMEGSKKRPISLFEPILVEYMSLEHKVCVASTWDRLPKSWERLRQSGYGYTQAKVEALWAFCLAHENVIKNSPTLERFPKLLKCIKRVIAAVKVDLGILKDLEPRRYFYAKHILALRFVMNRRLEKLIKFTEEGWVTEGDGEGLINSLQERIVQTDQYTPCLGTRAELKRCHQHMHMLHTPSYSSVAAWRGLELPRFIEARRNSTSSQASRQSPRRRVSQQSGDSERSVGTGSVETDASLRSGYSLTNNLTGNWWTRRRQSQQSRISVSNVDPTQSTGSSRSPKVWANPSTKPVRLAELDRAPDGILPPGTPAQDLPMELPV